MCPLTIKSVWLPGILMILICALRDSVMTRCICTIKALRLFIFSELYGGCFIVNSLHNLASKPKLFGWKFKRQIGK